MVVPANKFFVALDIFAKHGKWPVPNKTMVVLKENGKLGFVTALQSIQLNLRVMLTKDLFEALLPSFKEGEQLGTQMLNNLIKTRVKKDDH